jgi:hypothetical protein
VSAQCAGAARGAGGGVALPSGTTPRLGVRRRVTQAHARRRRAPPSHPPSPTGPQLSYSQSHPATHPRPHTQTNTHTHAQVGGVCQGQGRRRRGQPAVGRRGVQDVRAAGRRGGDAGRVWGPLPPVRPQGWGPRPGSPLGARRRPGFDAWPPLPRPAAAAALRGGAACGCRPGRARQARRAAARRVETPASRGSSPRAPLARRAELGPLRPSPCARAPPRAAAQRARRPRRCWRRWTRASRPAARWAPRA